MKKILLISLMATSLFVTGCDKSKENGGEYQMENCTNETAFYAGNIVDNTDENSEKIYKLKAMVTDQYLSNCATATDIIFYDNKGNVIQEQCNNTQIQLTKGQTYFIKIKTATSNESFNYELYPINNHVVTPYEINTTTDLSKFDVSSVDGTVIESAEIDYQQRKGGTYLYSNVPESMPSEVLDTILMRHLDLTGECFLTFEHQNNTGTPLYMGYRITNTEDHDIYITVTNVGYQTKGSWLGEKSWMDYYGVQYEMDTSNFLEGTFEYDGQTWTAMDWFNAYLAFDTNYTPNPIKPVTYKIPAGEHMYVIGGTTEDSYKGINVNGTADVPVAVRECINGNVKFIITNGKARGDLCVYTDIEKINQPDVKVQFLRPYSTDDTMGGRIGYSPIHGVIDNNPVWTFNDAVRETTIGVYYTNYYADTLKESYEPFEKVENITAHEVRGTKWLTHLSAQLNHLYTGKDMIDIISQYNGEEIVLSNYIANPAGNIWDYGNWMIEYQDNCTFVNRGNVDRKIKFYMHNGGSLFYIAKDENNNILKAGATLTTCTGRNVPIFEFVVPAHSAKMISMQYVLPANTVGSVEHYIELSVNQ